ncbi:MAG: bifunctional rhamnulose-1-phosphate aldolase/short-chain dehydrogenase [Rhodothermaceae bacterium]|nr:bifunctional rhamnulose-1-phosphate aldolase/short-chain dehydrogenase [Rhodothermaceae bacterium]MYF63397.1 bifunctional rhamnulose-1-phosphate aldolase/short-chain dehydrogenase [Rhodothermaceae bacterium]MYI84392.1 bifunctional rhamnulose-1-phosphate aldolase/short-chain dehydrogenase [Rhodothermaceae bacterium]
MSLSVPESPVFKYITDRWEDQVANTLDPVERLVYRSNLLGQDWRITNTGGGNTSTKLKEKDPLTGESVSVLWIKGSGGDLRTATRKYFASLYQDRLLALQQLYASKSSRGIKSEAEDAMVAAYRHCVFNLNTRAPSIDTPLHSFVPYSHVDHTHPVACIALATAADGPALTHEIYETDVIWVDWQRPGFELGLELQAVCAEYPEAKGVLLGGHGLINWAESDKACYHLSLALADRAEIFLADRGAGTYAFGGVRHKPLSESTRTSVLVGVLPWLRGKVSQHKRCIATLELDPQVVDFVNSADAPRLAELGTSCPDHFLRTKIKPLYVEWDPEQGEVDALKAALATGLEQYRKDYAAYYAACRHPDSPPIRTVEPTVTLIPGIGLIAWGKSKSESRVTAEFYRAAIGVMQGAEVASTYTALPRQEAFDIEYWSLEEAKLRRMPQEKGFEGQVVIIFGAGSGIGRETAVRMAAEGANIVVVDLNESAAEEVSDSILQSVGMGIGVAGTGVSGCGNAIGLGCDITERTSVRKVMETAIVAYGGLDHVIITAGMFPGADATGAVPDAAWDRTFAVNVKGSYIVASEAAKIWEAQQLRGSLVLTGSVNGVVPKSGSMAYDTSKSALNHLVRELAVAYAPLIRVNGIAPATVIAGSSMFGRARVIDSLRKYGLPCSSSESTDTLRERLADFYAERTLTEQRVTAKDQAEAAILLASRKLGKTTGQILNVDGGLEGAFLR